MDWLAISQEEKLSIDFMKEHANDLHWLHIIKNHKISPSFIDKIEDKINWSHLSKTMRLSFFIVDNYFLFFDIEQLRSNLFMSPKTVKEIENRYKNFWNPQDSLHISSKVAKKKKKEKVLFVRSIPYTFPILQRQEKLIIHYDLTPNLLVLEFQKKMYDEKKQKTMIALQKDSDMFTSPKEKRAFYYFINDFLLTQGKIKEHITTTNALDLPF